MEAQLQEHLRRRCRDVYKRVLYFHAHRSQYSPAGYPDTTLVGPARMAYAELKRCGHKPTPAQRTWIEALRRVGQDVYVWTPLDLLSGEIDRVLADLSTP